MQESELCLTELTSIARVTVCCRTNDPGRPFLTPPVKEERVLSNCPLVYWPEKVTVSQPQLGYLSIWLLPWTVSQYCHPFSKVLFNFPSWYLLASGSVDVFSLRRSLPPA